MADTIPDVPPAITQQVSTVATTWATAPALVGPLQHRAAVEALTVLQLMRREIQGFFRELKKTVNAHRKNLLDREKALLAPGQPVEEHLTDLIAAFDAAHADAAREAARDALAHPPERALRVSSEGDAHGEGYSSRPRLVPVVTDKLALIAAVAEGRVPLEAVDVNVSIVRRMAEEQGALLDLPGVEITTKITIVTHAN